MEEPDNSQKNPMDKTNTSGKNAPNNMEDWLNEHGQPDFEYLQSLVADGSEEAMEKLRSIADDLNVDYGSDTSTEELIGRIISTAAQNEDGGPDATT